MLNEQRTLNALTELRDALQEVHESELETSHSGDADHEGLAPESCSYCRAIQEAEELLESVPKLPEKNEIAGIEIRLFEDGYYRAFVTKTFEPQYGGGQSTIPVSGAISNIHVALDAARKAVTCTRTDKTAFEAEAVKE